jgi:hypothetical protein
MLLPQGSTSRHNADAKPSVGAEHRAFAQGPLLREHEKLV